MNEPVVSTTGPAVATWLPGAPVNTPPAPFQVTSVAVAGCPPLTWSGTVVPDDCVRPSQADGPPAPGSVTEGDSSLPAGS